MNPDRPEPNSKDHVLVSREWLTQMEQKIARLEARVDRAEDIEAIKKLTRIYGYYLDKALWDQMLPLFTPDCSIEISHLGVYVGTAQAEVLFKKILGTGPAKSDENGLLPGQLYNHLILQGVVHVSADGEHAQGRWRTFMQMAEFGQRAQWGEGPYEITYRKMDGLWRIQSLHFYRTFHTPYDESWVTARSPKGGIRENFPPDHPPTVDYEPYPGAFVPPFHYKNPVTGE